MHQNSYRILIVDNAKAIARRVELLFAEHRETITTITLADSYAQAVQLLQHQAYQLVLLDIHLKDKSGMNLLQHIKLHYPETIVIMFTNNATPEYRNACLQLGANAFLDKTTDFEILPKVVMQSLLEVYG
ncbi:MAG TPA: response regulator [Ferruginibacter sp.]|nr:response regulator [Ferruginibacter sp.]HRN79023.1 response regulator [Ferruginibacter sp.]HRO16725.1 response regulator [Ferruginibacter sp.]HRQ19832.1 response regulator [Ferruginibacter sp.]